MGKPIVITIAGKARHGKDTAAEWLKSMLEVFGRRVLILHYADYVKYIASKYFGWDGEKDEKGRTLLQYIGTDLVRAKDKNFWVDTVARLINVLSDEYDYFLIPDTRFPNEVDYFTSDDYHSTSVRVTRLNFESELTPEQQQHPSEIALDNYEFDYELQSESGVDNLKREVYDLTAYLLTKEVYY